MSLFNKFFASVGIGAAKVDTLIEKIQLAPGDTVKGFVKIQGGNVEQKIDSVSLTIYATYIREMDEKKYTSSGVVEKVRLFESMMIQPHEKKEIPFSFTLPLDTPLSMGKTQVWVSTGLDIKNAVDPTDKDFIKVEPTRLMAAVLEAVNDLGFRLREVECEESSVRIRRRLPFVQEFEFVPVAGTFRGRLDELEVTFFPRSLDETELLIQVDRRARGIGGLLAEALEMDETNVRLTVTSADIPMMKEKIQRVISQYS